MDKEEFERLFDQAYEEAVRSHSVASDPSPSWSKVERILRRRRRRQRRLAMLPYLSASFVLGALLFSSPLVSKAVSPIFQSVQSIQNGVVSLIFGSARHSETSTIAKTPPPPKDAALSTCETISEIKIHQDVQYSSWEDAASDTAFRHLSIGYVAPSFALSETRLVFTDQSGLASRAILLYTNEQEERYRITIRIMEANEVTTSGIFGTASKTETIHLESGEGFLVQMEDGRTVLEYLHGNLHISISGHLTEEQVIEVANHID